MQLKYTRLIANGRRLITVVAACCILLLARPASAKAQTAAATDTAALLTRHIYPFLSLVNNNQQLLSALARYKPLRKMARANNKVLRGDLKAGRLESAIRDLALTQRQVQTLTRALIFLNRHNPDMAAAIQKIRATGAYSWNPADPDSAFLRKMTENITGGFQYALNVYYFGRQPQYGKIDGISIDLKDQHTRSALRDSLLRWSSSRSAGLAYYLPLQAALNALRLNGRTEAIWYDPLTQGMNGGPWARVKQTDFSRYKYSAILVPGLGPELPEVRLTEGGKQRCRIALTEFNKGEAAFLIVSGGHVHPNKTPFCEAVEMKKYMVDSLHVDEAKILIEPYARHTTTNLRNSARLIKLMGMPFQMPVLIVTDEAQSAYINKGMRKVSFRDLGYTPYSHLQVLAPTLTSFIPEAKSLIINPLDPLDP